MGNDNTGCVQPVPVTQAFEREERFIVVKRKHLTAQKEASLRRFLRHQGIPTVESVVVESDWPEYETVWRMIEDRATARIEATALPDARADGLAEELEPLRGLFHQWLTVGANYQPHYRDGMRPFSTGDLRHYEQLLGAAIAALRTSTPQPAEGAAERIRQQVEATREAAAKVELWFFRDCNAGTRRCLFSIFGLPVDEITDQHRERLALRHILAASMPLPLNEKEG